MISKKSLTSLIIQIFITKSHEIGIMASRITFSSPHSKYRNLMGTLFTLSIAFLVISIFGTAKAFSPPHPPVYHRSYMSLNTDSNANSGPSWEDENNETTNDEDYSIVPVIVAGFLIILIVVVITYFTLQEQERQKKERKAKRRQERRKKKRETSITKDTSTPATETNVAKELSEEPGVDVAPEGSKEEKSE